MTKDKWSGSGHTSPPPEVVRVRDRNGDVLERDPQGRGWRGAEGDGMYDHGFIAPWSYGSPEMVGPWVEVTE